MPTEPIPSELLDYVRDLFAPDHAALHTLTQAARDANMPVDWEISPDVGRFFQLMCKAVGARRVVEFGTLAGHSAYWLASALPADGKVISIEINPDFAAAARAALAKVGVGDKVEVRVGSAFAMTPELEREVTAPGGQKFDAIFLDTDKTRYPEFLDWAVRVLRPGGLLLADNVLRSSSWRQKLLDPNADEPRVVAIREFNRKLATHPDFTSYIMPLRAGVAVGVFQPSV